MRFPPNSFFATSIESNLDVAHFLRNHLVDGVYPAFMLDDGTDLKTDDEWCYLAGVCQ